ncbi:MAG: exodeoxyribonuclease III [bacterium]
MKIATFNVNSVRSRMGILLDWLRDHQPDVMAIQETKVVDADFPVAPFREAGYHVAFKGEKSYNGVAILSLREPGEVRFGLDDGGPADATRLAHVKMGAVHVVNTYIPQGRDIEHEMYRYKLQWFERLRGYFERHFKPADQVVWVGDFNVAPAAMDIHNSKQQANHVCYHVDARNAFARTQAWGFVDVFRKHHPEPGQYTFFDYRQRDSVKKNCGWRIDFIMATQALAAKSVDAKIDLAPRLAEKPSDHTVLMAEFRV